MTDAQLIEQFVTQRSQRAFGELVARHIGWVSASARRRLHDPSLADDATQATFILLAQKAHKLRRETVLSSWLFAALRYTCIATARAERRRQHHQERAAMLRSAVSNDPEQIWDDVSEQLDEAVAKLREGDRRAVLLRFYQDHTFAQVGALLGVSEEAARKRVERAVEKLSTYLRRAGVSVTPAVLGPVLVSHVTSPVAVPVASSVAAAALSAGASSASSVAKAAGSLIAWAHLKAAAVVLAVCATVTAGGAAVVAVSHAPATTVTVAATRPVTQPVAATAPASQAGENVISGIVVTPDDKPFAGATVYGVGNRWGEEQSIVATVTTDAAGRFPITSPLGITLSNAVIDAPPWGLTAADNAGADERKITLKPPGEIELTVLGPDDKPVANIAVAPAFASGGGVLMDEWWSMQIPPALGSKFAVKTDDKGIARLTRLPQGSRIYPQVFDDRFARPDFSNELPVPAKVARTVNTLKLQLAASIAGRVTKADGTPASGVLVMTSGLDEVSSSYGIARTGADGRYLITRLKAGSYNVVVDFSDDSEKQPKLVAVARERVVVAAGKRTDNIDFAGVTGTWLRGKVTFRDTKRPATQISVGAYGPARPRSGGAVHSTSTAADGTYALRVPPGEHVVYIAEQPPEGYLGPNTEDRKVNVPAAGATVNFELPPAPGKPVSGVVVTADGKPAANAWVTAVPDRNGNMMDQIQVQSDAQGRFSFKRLQKASIFSSASGGVRTTQPVKVKGGERDVVLRVQRSSPVTLRGRIVDDRGKPVPSASVMIFVQRGQYGMGMTQVETDADGRYEIGGLRLGDEYSLSAKAPRHGENHAPVKLPADQTVAEQPDIVLPHADSFIIGTVVDASGKPVANLPVNASGGKTQHQKTTTDANGKFEFTNIVAGEKVSFWFTPNGQWIDGGFAEAGELDARLVFKPPPSKKN